MSLRLNVGASHSRELDPALLFIPTGVFVQPGECYQLTADGRWKDGRIVCDADGWTIPGLGWLRRRNRLPGVNWFALVVCVGETTRTARLVGRSGELVVTEQDCLSVDGEPAQLFAFANDWPSRYSNNKVIDAGKGGPMRLTIGRLA